MFKHLFCIKNLTVYLLYPNQANRRKQPLGPENHEPEGTREREVARQLQYPIISIGLLISLIETAIVHNIFVML